MYYLYRSNCLAEPEKEQGRQRIVRGMKRKRKKLQQSTRYIPYQQSTNTTDNIRPSYIKNRSPMVDCGIGDPPDTLEWPKPEMVGLSKKLACQKWTTGKDPKIFHGFAFAEHTGRPNKELLSVSAKV